MLKENTPEILSEQEKSLLCMIQDEADVLPYNLVEKITSIGTMEYVYDIPENDKEMIFRDVFPFENFPKMDSILFDIHERKSFIFKDSLVIRWKNRNMLVTPYYLSSGGTVLDMVEDEWTDTVAFKTKLK